jgi:hypothetical protein
MGEGCKIPWAGRRLVERRPRNSMLCISPKKSSLLSKLLLHLDKTNHKHNNNSEKVSAATIHMDSIKKSWNRPDFHGSATFGCQFSKTLGPRPDRPLAWNYYLLCWPLDISDVGNIEPLFTLALATQPPQH